MDKKLLMVLSPGWEPVQPYGLACLKSFLLSKGFYAEVLDLNIKLFEDLVTVSSNPTKKKVLNKGARIILKKISDENFDAVSFSVYDPSFENAIYLSKIIKSELDGDIQIAIGGPHISYIQGEVMDFDCIDIAIVGEGEIPLLKFMQKLSSGRDIRSPYYYCRVNGKVISQSKVEVIKTLDLLPYPDYSDIDVHSYPLPAVITSMSRGCISNCSFCGVPNIYCGYRHKSPAYIMNELQKIIQDNNCNLVLITDALINANPYLLSKVCNKIKEKKLEVYWASEALPNISKTLATKMYESGCRFVYVSPETGSQKIADLMCKGVKIKVAQKTFENLDSADITTSAWFIFGFPLETRCDTKRTFNFLSHINSFVDEVIFSPFGLSRNTPIYNNPKKFGIKEVEKRPYKMYCYYVPEDEKFELRNQTRNFIELWNKYSSRPFPSDGIYKEIIEMAQGSIEPSKDLQFLIGPKYEEAQFLYKGYGQDIKEDYSYVKLFKESFKEIFSNNKS